jgi:hypothetical protein
MKLKLALVGLVALGGAALTAGTASAMPIGLATNADIASNIDQVRLVCNAYGRFAGELPDTRITTTADQPSVLVMVADTGDMDMGRDMDTAMDMAIAVGDFRGLRPPPLF